MSNTSSLRSRWAALGAAVAVTLGAGGVGITQATIGSGERAVFVPITPCRLADTRPAPDQVGPRSAGLGPNETYTLDGRGSVGNCNLANGATGLVLNVTAVGATQQTNLRFYPAGAPLPAAANLNPTPGAPPTPNAVTVDLNSNGRFSVYNRFGSVAVIIDVVGYYEHHDHDDRYYTRTQTDARVLAASEVIATPGKSLPTLADESEFADTTAETVTSTTTGQWLISKTVRGYLVCPTTSPFFFLLLDGVPLYSSAIVTQSGAYNSLTLVGATTAPIPPGAHTVAVGADCMNESKSGNGIFFATAATVTVLE